MIKNVGIIGAGTMGSGIAQVAASAGCKVVVYDSYGPALVKSEDNLDRILSRLQEKGKLTEDRKNEIQTGIHYASSLRELTESDLIIEAIVENYEIKVKVLRSLEALVKPECIIASNTSSLSIASIAASLDHPMRCVGIHFFNPAPLMSLVEIIPAIQTSQEVFDLAMHTIASWGKVAVKVKDTPGFIVNRVARPFYGEALRIYEEGIAEIAAIDHAVKKYGGFKMGPFELMDFIGNDVNYTVTETVFNAFYFDPRYKPSFTQKRLSEAGWLGRKSQRGYYHYDEHGHKIEADLHPNEELGKQILNRILVMLINEAADAVFWNIATAEDIDKAMTLGVNYPKGLLTWADEVGIAWCVNTMDQLYNKYREDRYRCSPLLRRLLQEKSTFF